MFGDAKMTTALLDRLFLHSSAVAKKRIKAREQARKGAKAEPAEESF